MNILITNDDGINAPGLGKLAEMASRYGNVFVVAPDGPRSAQSMALTITIPISAKIVRRENNITWYQCSGSPADCVKLACSQLLDPAPDIILSGINHGSNTSVNVLYSGTIGAALEGAMHNVPSIGFSICDHSLDVSFDYCLPHFERVLANTIKHGLPHDVCLNVNAPVGPVKGIRLCRQSAGRWANDFTRDNAPRTVDYYWMVGDFFNTEPDESADQASVELGYITVVPIQTDMTAFSAMEHCKKIVE